jgi:hypothetical protein
VLIGALIPWCALRKLVPAVILLLSAGCARDNGEPAEEATTGERAGLFLPALGAAPRAQSDGVPEIDWLDLLPADERERLLAGEWPEFEIDHTGDRAMAQVGSAATVPQMQGLRMRIPGQVVPLEIEADGAMRSFFLVPYYGACLHMLPPPPNQILYAELDRPEPPPEVWEPVFLTGTLRIEYADTELADASYRVVDASLTPGAE